MTKIDRRRGWQLKKVAEGKCPNCGKETSKYYCEECRLKKNKLQWNYQERLRKLRRNK